MSEPQDPLRSLFQQAGQFGQARSAAPGLAHITERGERAHRGRLALLAAGACLFVAGSAAAVTLLPGDPPPTAPATSPSPSDHTPAPSSRTQPSDLPLPDRTATQPPPPGGESSLRTNPQRTQPPTSGATTSLR
ncbi:hypothetical protein ACFZAV_42970 [Streptomyces sp. NPDC008343]|uniref:hypothetical protein n=1 Tax=Streptomyces sp. NPDC008343 TaxID=3364828 RepID=UPI0036E97D1B